MAVHDRFRLRRDFVNFKMQKQLARASFIAGNLFAIDVGEANVGGSEIEFTHERGRAQDRVGTDAIRNIAAVAIDILAHPELASHSANFFLDCFGLGGRKDNIGCVALGGWLAGGSDSFEGAEAVLEAQPGFSSSACLCGSRGSARSRSSGESGGCFDVLLFSSLHFGALRFRKTESLHILRRDEDGVEERQREAAGHKGIDASIFSRMRNRLTWSMRWRRERGRLKKDGRAEKMMGDLRDTGIPGRRRSKPPITLRGRCKLPYKASLVKRPK